MKPAEYLNVVISCHPDYTEILVAELSVAGFDSMMETESGLEAYILKDDFNEADVTALQERYPEAGLSYQVDKVIERNWNEEWEKNYDPIRVDDDILVRATFHEPDPSVKYELVINPRMSFGTGHHATTYLMLKSQLDIDHAGKKVLDAGCGTAILAVMAEKLGASEVLAYDNNAWSTENAPENIELNSCSHVKIQEGIISTIDANPPYDIILANINRNVLLEEIPAYVSHLSDGGTLLLSGFYTEDESQIQETAEGAGLQLQSKRERNNWSCMRFVKIS